MSCLRRVSLILESRDCLISDSNTHVSFRDRTILVTLLRVQAFATHSVSTGRGRP